MTRVLIVDDHPVFRRGLAVMLDSAGYTVIGEAASGEEAVAEASASSPDLVVMDIGLPGMGGIAATAHVLAAAPACRVVMLTMRDDAASVRGALEAGASGYVVKDSAPHEVIAAIGAVVAGATVVGSGVGLEALRGPAEELLPELTMRERVVADLLEKGLPNRAIAERLGITDKTAANYVASVKLKLGAPSRHDVAASLRTRRES